MALIALPKFERLLRAAASLDVDNEDLRRLDDFIHAIEALLIRGGANAKANVRASSRNLTPNEL